MRLYLNSKEVEVIKDALSITQTVAQYATDTHTEMIADIIMERIRLCEQLQSNKEVGKKITT